MELIKLPIKNPLKPSESNQKHLYFVGRGQTRPLAKAVKQRWSHSLACFDVWFVSLLFVKFFRMFLLPQVVTTAGSESGMSYSCGRHGISYCRPNQDRASETWLYAGS